MQVKMVYINLGSDKDYCYFRAGLDHVLRTFRI